MALPGERWTGSVSSIGIPFGTLPASTTSAGTATSGTTETFDAVLGYYQATLIYGHQYMAMVTGLVGNGSVVADLFSAQIRDSQSSSNPTSGSVLICSTGWYVVATGSAGRTGIGLGGPFTCTVGGVHTFGVSATRIVGTGVFTPESALASGAARQLFVVDLGGN